jgi:uncharacterized protein YndB with AHSA1/START domain
MTGRSVIHSTFSIERRYEAATDLVFAAWADPAAKARWFAGPAGEHELDFRVGGREVNRGSHDGRAVRFESCYADIVHGERIVYTSTLYADDTPITVSLTTVEFSPAGRGTRLLLTEHGAFLDGHEQPGWREQGTRDWLGALDTELRRAARQS